MAFDPLFLLPAVLTIGPAVAVFLQKSILHSVFALTASFIGSALLFLYLGQGVVTLLQLLVFVGGLSTYLVVSIATERKERQIGIGSFLLLLAVLLAGFSTVAAGTAGSQFYNNSFLAAAGGALAAYYPLLFFISFLLFAATIGSVLILRKYIRLIV